MRAVASRTATVVALWRAKESARSATARLFVDPIATACLDWRSRLAVRLSRLPVVGERVPWSLIDGHWPGARGTVAVRTRYIDDLLATALARGVDQVVIFAAGFDSRAYRVPGIERTRVFELDHPATQARKIEIVERRLGGVPSHVAMIAIDFNTQAFDTVLANAGYRRDGRTFFILEGVTHYLSPDAVDTLFRRVARNAAAGSQMVFTYIRRAAIDGSATFYGADKTLAAVRRAGEPYMFGFEPSELREYVETRNLVLIEDVDASTYRERYLTPLGRGHEALAEFQRAALVEVAGNAEP